MTMKITLTIEQKRELKPLHSTTRDGRVRDRVAYHAFSTFQKRFEAKYPKATDRLVKDKNLSQKGFIPNNEATSKMQHGLVVFDFLFPTNKQSTITV